MHTTLCLHRSVSQSIVSKNNCELCNTVGTVGAFGKEVCTLFKDLLIDLCVKKGRQCFPQLVSRYLPQVSSTNACDSCRQIAKRTCNEGAWLHQDMCHATEKFEIPTNKLTFWSSSEVITKVKLKPFPST